MSRHIFEVWRKRDRKLLVQKNAAKHRLSVNSINKKLEAKFVLPAQICHILYNYNINV